MQIIHTPTTTTIIIPSYVCKSETANAELKCQTFGAKLPAYEATSMLVYSANWLTLLVRPN